MATITRRLKDPLVYLEQVRQHLGRLPSIDPNTRTLLICGYPNVGKSSFLRSISRADVDVQPYAFTTKSLFVGHFDYKYLRFQAIDTPGILDHPLEDMNTIEMQSITAIAHLRSAILYFMDLSEQCGYPIASQIALFQSIKPLFQNKLCFIVINKVDVVRPKDLDDETKASLDALLTQNSNVQLLELSCITSEGVTSVKSTACDALIASRVAAKLASAPTSADGSLPSGRLGDVLTRIHVAQPIGGIVREPYIPEFVKAQRANGNILNHKKSLARDVEAENGGAGVYNVDMKSQYQLANPDWTHDTVPEILNGRNVADFIDPDIEAKLADLDEEEERLEAEGFYDDEDDEVMEEADEVNTRIQANLIREKLGQMRNESTLRKRLKNNKAIIPRPALRRPISSMSDTLDRLGYDPRPAIARVQAKSRGRSVVREVEEGAEAMDIDTPAQNSKSKVRSRSQSNRRTDGVALPGARDKAERLAKLGQKKMNRMARQGEADRYTTASLPKHLVSFFHTFPIFTGPSAATPLLFHSPNLTCVPQYRLRGRGESEKLRGGSVSLPSGHDPSTGPIQPDQVEPHLLLLIGAIQWTCSTSSMTYNWFRLPFNLSVKVSSRR